MIIADRIYDRMKELGLKASPLARRLGVSPGYFSDLIHGKKKSFSAMLLPKLAAELSCDSDYLLGLQDKPRRDGEAAGMVLSGAVNRRAWFRPADDAWAGRPIPARPDVRYPADQQHACIHLGETARFGERTIPDGAVLVCVADGNYRPGDVVVAEERDDGKDGLMRRFVAEVGPTGATIRCEFGEMRIDDADVLGRITRVVQVL